ncbi:hypothetical protein BY458DRAFT_512743 [Sporodiniella umbellata]|nr:hypothetical protein BY458DRAFT_512743 [Sporodiniella umbellata]
MQNKNYRLSIIIALATIISIESVVVVVVAIIHFGIQSFFLYETTRVVFITPLLKMAFQCSRGNKFLEAFGTSKFFIDPANRNCLFFFFFNKKVA